jgi:hypothetical protein
MLPRLEVVDLERRMTIDSNNLQENVMVAIAMGREKG